MVTNPKAYRVKGLFPLFGSTSLFLAITVLTVKPVLSQVVPDTTLGAERSIVSPTTLPQGLPIDLIEGGAIRGGNLFHSFTQFSIPEGQGAYFANPIGIENILSRVTGNSISNIFGTLGVLGNANLFLINPNGILFGPNARLDIKGSFLGSTADRFVFPDGNEFSATQPQGAPLITVNVPIGVQFGPQATGTIVNQGNLSVGKDLTLSGSSVTHSGSLMAPGNLSLLAQNTVQVRDSATTPAILSAGGNLLVQGNQSIDIFALNNPASGLFSGRDMVLRSATPVQGDAHYWAGGDFRIEQFDGTLGSLVSPGDPIIRASGDVAFTSYVGASLHILAGGSVTIGSITINGPDATGNAIGPTTSDAALANVTLSNKTPLGINGVSQPTLDIRAGTTAFGTPQIQGTNFTTLTPTPNVNAAASGADIRITGTVSVTSPDGLIFLTNQFQPNTVPSGNITVTTLNTRSSAGNGGAIVIDGRSNVNFSQLNAGSTFASGSGGNVTVLAQGNITGLTTSPLNSLIDVSTTSRTAGSGNVIVQARGDLSLRTAASALPIARTVLASGATGGLVNLQGQNVTLGGSLASISSENTTNQPLAAVDRLQVTANQTLTLDRAILLTNALSRSGQEVNTGNIVLSAGNRITVSNNSSISSQLNGLTTTAIVQGSAGDIRIMAPQVIFNSAVSSGSLSTSTSNQGNAGNILIQATEFVSLERTRINSEVLENATGRGGNITISTPQLTLNNESFLNTSIRSSSDAGKITIQNANQVTVSNNSSIVTSVRPFPNASGNGGNVDIQTNELRLLSNSRLQSETFGIGDAGTIVVRGANSILLDGNSFISSAVEAGATGRGGLTDLQANTLTLQGGTQITARTVGIGDAGDIKITAPNAVTLSNPNTQITTQTTNSGAGGKIDITTGTLRVTDRAELNASTTAGGAGGSIQVNTSVFEANGGGRLLTSTSGAGAAGSISLGSASRPIDRLTLTDVNTGLFASANTGSTGAGGAIDLFTNTLALDNAASIAVSTGGSGNAGNIRFTVPNGSVTMTKGAQVLASTTGQGNAGTITVTNPNGVVTLSNPNTRISTQTSSSGTGGAIDITTGTFQLADGAELNASTTGTGAGGTITVTANTFTVDSTGTLNTSTSGSGSGGTVTVNANTVTAGSGGRLVTNTTGPGAAGNVVLNVVDRIFLTGQGTGIFANATETSTGPGGNIFIDPRLVELRDGATISVGSLGTGLGGSISLQAGTLLLDNASLSAISNSADGGNIALSVNDLILLRNGSNISATAGVAQSSGNGGNVTIATRFLVAPPFEDSNISANAFTGRGGNIRIAAQALFGIGFQPRPTRFSDITASSEFGVNGIVLITTPGIDPSKGLEALSADAVDASNLISQGCAAASNVSSFILTGRGGLPPGPTDAISGDSVLDDTRLPTSQRLTSPTAVVPAQGWVLKDNGDVTLTAQLIPNQCHAR